MPTNYTAQVVDPMFLLIMPASPTNRLFSSSTASSQLIGQPQTFLKLAVSTATAHVTASFDPVSAEQARRTQALNLAVRLGYEPPSSSTR
jgi:hypothetical protein